MSICRKETDSAADRRRFQNKLEKHAQAPLKKDEVEILQINVGDRCNQSCAHCHVEASPAGTRALQMDVAKQIVKVASASPAIQTVDLTGGAPELNGCFGYLVEEMTALGKKVIDRCNLSVLLEPGVAQIPELLRSHRVEVVASLPCYTEPNVDAQRGAGTFQASIEGIRRLNEVGYGKDSQLPLTLVYNPGGGFLPGERAGLERDYKDRLKEDFGVVFTSLQTMINMPIGRFKKQLESGKEYDAYITLLESSFNPKTVNSLMCRNLVSVYYDGTLYDCDFNIAQSMPVEKDGKVRTVFALESFDTLAGDRIQTANHCLGCTGGTGSGCFGELA